MFEHLCKERDGPIWRSLRPLPHDIEVISTVVDKALSVQHGWGDENPYETFFDPEMRAWLVDDVGIIIASFSTEHDMWHFHFVFWDKRMRGREGLVRTVLEWISSISGKRIITMVPDGRRALHAFALRVGGRVISRSNNHDVIEFDASQPNYSG